MLGQCWALLMLKWAILRNSWSTAAWVSGVLLGLTVLFLAALSLGLALAAFFLGWRGVGGGQDSLALLLIMDGAVVFFVFLYFWGLLFELQRSDVVDLRKMLHFPVSLPMVFGLNFLTSLLSPALLFFAPSAIGFVGGLALRYGPQVLLGLLLALAFFLMLGAWAYYARGVLAILMENKRRRRIIMAVLPLAFVLMAQVPNLLIQTQRERIERNGGKSDWSNEQAEYVVVLANAAIPIGWLPYGVWRLTTGAVFPAGLCLAGLSGVAGVGLALGFRSTVRHYRGETGPRRKKTVALPPQRRVATAWRMPLLGEDTSAMLTAEFLGYSRHPNIRMLLIMPICMGLFLLFMYKNGAYGDRNVQGAWMPLIVLVWPFFNFSMVLFNLFGVDLHGFRGMLLFPMPRHKYFLAKNLALFPFVAGLSLAFVLCAAALMDTAPRYIFISLIQVLQLYLMYCIVGNFISLYFPYRIARDTLRARANRPLMLLLGLVSMVVVSVMVIPTSVCLMLDDLVAAAWGPQGYSVGLIASAVLLAITAAAYAASLTHAGDLLLVREQRILESLSRDRE